LRATLKGPAWIAAAATGVATLGVAAFPLHHSPTVDSVHGVFAGTGYATISATALFAGVELARRGRRRWAIGAIAAGTVSAAALVLTRVGSYEGLFQRVGLTAGDVWVVASAVAILGGSLTTDRAIRSGYSVPPVPTAAGETQ
jgi:hypothetical protein